MFRRLLFSGVGVLTAIIALLGMKGVFSRILEVEGWTYLGFTMLFVMLVSAVIYLIYRVKNIEINQSEEMKSVDTFIQAVSRQDEAVKLLMQTRK